MLDSKQVSVFAMEIGVVTKNVRFDFMYKRNLSRIKVYI